MKYIFLLISVLSVRVALAQVDTIDGKHERLITTRFHPGLHHYLTYIQSTGSSKKLGLWYWFRRGNIETVNGEQVITISQQWLSSDTGGYRKIFSINKASDFTPIFHSEVVKGVMKAYNWSTDRVVGADTVAGNQQKSFYVKLRAPSYNWNLDMETFEMMPLAKGKTFAVNFYDAGLEPPEYMLYKVTGSESIPTFDGGSVDCWVLFHEGGTGENKFSQTFWISKHDHEFIKEKDKFKGGYFYKIRLPDGSPDILNVLDKL
ncbi:MAG: DUF3108 domain-containing protein [Mucilaginibacter sp.]